MKDAVKIFGVQDAETGNVLEDHWSIQVDCSGRDYRAWWRRAWDRIRCIEWGPRPLNIVLPNPKKYPGPFKIVKIDDTDNPVIISTPIASVCCQYEYWSNDPKDMSKDPPIDCLRSG